MFSDYIFLYWFIAFCFTLTLLPCFIEGQCFGSCFCATGGGGGAADAPWAIQFRLVRGARREKRKTTVVKVASLSNTRVAVLVFKIKPRRREFNGTGALSEGKSLILKRRLQCFLLTFG